MPTRRRVGAWLLWALVLPQLTRAQDVSEQQLVELILREGTQAAVIRASVEVTAREQLARTAFPNPSVSYTQEGAGFTEFLQVEQFVPIFGTRGVLARAGAAASAAAEAERDARLWQLRSDAQMLVARLMSEQRKIDVWQNAIRDVEAIVQLLRVREREGEGSRFDRLRAEHELADARQAGADAAAAAAEALALIAAATGSEPGFTRVTGVVSAEGTVPTVNVLISRASASRAELRALLSASERFNLEASAARRARLPAPTITAGLKRADTDTTRQAGGIVSINLAVPLFDSGRRESARWIAEGARVDAERTFTAQLVRAQVTGAAAVLEIRQEALRVADAAVVIDDLAQIAMVAYRDGEIGILELLDAHRTVARVRLRSIEIRHTARVAQIALERAVGDRLWP